LSCIKVNNIIIIFSLSIYAALNVYCYCFIICSLLIVLTAEKNYWSVNVLHCAFIAWKILNMGTANFSTKASRVLRLRYLKPQGVCMLHVSNHTSLLILNVTRCLCGIILFIFMLYSYCCVFCQ